MGSQSMPNPKGKMEVKMVGKAGPPSTAPNSWTLQEEIDGRSRPSHLPSTAAVSPYEPQLACVELLLSYSIPPSRPSQIAYNRFGVPRAKKTTWPGKNACGSRPQHAKCSFMAGRKHVPRKLEAARTNVEGGMLIDNILSVNKQTLVPQCHLTAREHVHPFL